MNIHSNEDPNQNAVSMQSDQSLRCPHEENVATLAIQNAHSEDSDQIARMKEGTFSYVAANFVNKT